MSKHFVYILRCKDNSLYTGYTTDLERRLQEHLSGKGAKYTRGRGPFQIVYEEELANKSEALRREAELKKLDRKDKLELIKREGNIDGLESNELLS